MYGIPDPARNPDMTSKKTETETDRQWALDELDDAMAAWHESDSTRSLVEWLGLGDTESALFVARQLQNERRTADSGE